jgi:SAM-dependent methyltransferase
MSKASRWVVPETLDELPPADSRARRSRRDLQRVHRAMGSLFILRRAIAGLRLSVQPLRIIELGAGDGTLLLRLAETIGAPWSGVHLTLLDRHDLLDRRTLRAYREREWDVTIIAKDVLEWAREPLAASYDLCLASLFLHHFDDASLRILLRAIANKSNAFVACEPRRGALGRFGSRLVGILGTNEVTRQDAVKSVAAGFAGRELTAAWSSAGIAAWDLNEFRALPFTHCFTAIRAGARAHGAEHAP